MTTSLKKKFPLPDCEKGMTLLEVMLAIMMLATVMAMISISISGSVNVIDATEKQGEIYYRAQVTLQRISEDLVSALLVEGIEFTGSSSENSGETGNLLEFTSTAHIVFDQENDHPGIALISYTLKPDPDNDNEFVLLRSDTVLRTFDQTADYRDEEKDGFLLGDRLRSVKFSYFNDAGEEFDTWSSEPQDSDDELDRRLPVSINVTLEFWLNHEDETSIEFTTGVMLPMGLLNTEVSPGGNSA